jgi:hypothetical protein
MTMTFNSMMRLPGVEHIPWIDPNEGQYITMAYPVDSETISVSACAVEGRVLYSASFDSNRVDVQAVTRALERLRDMPALLEQPFLQATSHHLESAPIEWIEQPTVHNGVR